MVNDGGHQNTSPKCVIKQVISRIICSFITALLCGDGRAGGKEWVNMVEDAFPEHLMKAMVLEYRHIIYLRILMIAL